MITGLNHLTLAVTDLQKSVTFYQDVLQFKLFHQWEKGAYFLVGDLWFCLNVDENVKPREDYTHYAFSITDKNFHALEEKIRNAGTVIFKENRSPGKSLYFLDPDGHKLEIHVGSWQERLEVLQ